MGDGSGHPARQCLGDVWHRSKRAGQVQRAHAVNRAEPIYGFGVDFKQRANLGKVLAGAALERSLPGDPVGLAVGKVLARVREELVLSEIALAVWVDELAHAHLLPDLTTGNVQVTHLVESVVMVRPAVEMGGGSQTGRAELLRGCDVAVQQIRLDEYLTRSIARSGSDRSR